MGVVATVRSWSSRHILIKEKSIVLICLFFVRGGSFSYYLSNLYKSDVQLT